MLSNRGELISLLKEYGEEGCPDARLQEEGISVPMAVVTELRRDGHEIHVLGEGPDRRFHYKAPPYVGKRKRFRAQLSLFEVPANPRRAYDPE